MVICCKFLLIFFSLKISPGKYISDEVAAHDKAIARQKFCTSVEAFRTQFIPCNFISNKC